MQTQYSLEVVHLGRGALAGRVSEQYCVGKEVEGRKQSDMKVEMEKSVTIRFQRD